MNKKINDTTHSPYPQHNSAEPKVRNNSNRKHKNQTEVAPRTVRQGAEYSHGGNNKWLAEY